MSSSAEPATRRAEPGDPAPARKRGNARRWWLLVLLVMAALVAYVVVDSATDVAEPPEEAPPEPVDPPPEPEVEPPPVIESPVVDRMLYSEESIVAYRAVMAAPGPYFATGDAGHGGPYSPGDGSRAAALAEEFLDDPSASVWSQPDLPYSMDDPYPAGEDHARPMHAAWIYMTRPDHPERELLGEALTELLLTHAEDPSLDFSDAANYPVDFPGSAQGPIFHHAHWMTRAIKTRDMLGRETFTQEQNETFDRWIFGYANWSASWLQEEVYGNALPGRLDRDYSEIGWEENADRASFDGGPLIGPAGMAYSNRHAAVASAMSLAANYLEHYDPPRTTVSDPDYGVYTVTEIVDQSRLFVEETLRFSVWPEGVQGDFERGDAQFHDAEAQQGWLYSVNVLANLMEMAEYHAKRGDLSIWEFGTTEGYDGSAGVPAAGGFDEKDLHFYAWSMSRYVNDGWERTNRGEPLVLDNFYHDVIPAATAHRFAPDDPLLEAAWKREGEGFPPYPSSPQLQGPYHAHSGEGGKMIGLIEHAEASRLGR